MTEIVDGWLVPSVPPGSASRLEQMLGPGDLAIPLVFPDFRVRLPFQTGRRDPIRLELGHAGVVVINGENGAASYYEWGRYDEGRDIGQVRRRHVIRSSLRPVCRIRVAHLRRILSTLCNTAGEHTRVEAVIVPCDSDGYSRGVELADSVLEAFARRRQPADAWCAAPGFCFQSPFVDEHERIYAIADNNCLSFARNVAARASRLRLGLEGRTEGPDIPRGWADGIRWMYGFTRVDYRPGDHDITVDP